jgi:hypothetical protein
MISMKSIFTGLFRFVKGFTDLQMNLKSQIEFKEDIDKLKEFMLKSFYMK